MAWPLIVAAAASAVAGAIAKNGEAGARNAAIADSMDEAKAAAKQEMRNLAVSTVHRRQQRLDGARAAAGRIRTTSAASGGAGEGVLQQNVFDAGRDVGTIHHNYATGIDSIRRQLLATYAQLASGGANMGAMTMGGATGGVMTGLSLYGAGAGASE